jgi:hypothetical protein
MMHGVMSFFSVWRIWYGAVRAWVFFFIQFFPWAPLAVHGPSIFYASRVGSSMFQLGFVLVVGSMYFNLDYVTFVFFLLLDY